MTLLMLLFACAGRPTAAPDLPVQPDSRDLPVNEPSYEPTYGQPVDRVGTFQQDPVPGGKRLQAGSLVWDDGEVWIVSYRPIEKYFQFIDKRVHVRGRPYENSPLVQSVMATHFEIESIELAEGETPYDPVPTRIPAPPHVRDRAAFDARRGGWAQVVGTLSQLQPELQVTMADSTVVTIPSSSYRASAWQQNEGKTVTVTGRVAPLSEGEVVLWSRKVCAGEVERCGMTD